MKIHDHIAEVKEISSEELNAWYRGVSKTNVKYPGNVYTTVSALEEMGDVQRFGKGTGSRRRVRHLTPCKLR